MDLSLRRSNLDHTSMHISAEGLFVMLVVGLIAGWLAGKIMQGTGFGVVGDLVLGVIGAFVGGWLLPQLGLFPGGNLTGQIISATAGAIVLLLLITFVRRRVA